MAPGGVGYFRSTDPLTKSRSCRDIVQPDYCQLSIEEDVDDDDAESGGACSDGSDVRVNAWPGPAGTLSPPC